MHCRYWRLHFVPTHKVHITSTLIDIIGAINGMIESESDMHVLHGGNRTLHRTPVYENLTHLGANLRYQLIGGDPIQLERFRDL
mmetsp:Transcript_8552/g.14183  ORF Transcript_8552/g.14183 Transcript_8552/m.14183 type:complete len:84 (+) Transcript_8552:1688-1939(+)